MTNEIMHYGMPRRSGRYPFGSGKRPFQSLVEAHQKKKAIKEADRQKKKEYAANRKFRRNMTKEEKQEFINNLKLDREVKQLVDENLHPGRTAAKKMIADVGQRAIKDAATDLATKSLYWGVGKLINEASDKPNTSMPSLSEYLYGKNEHRDDTSDATRKMLNKAMKDAGISDKTIKALGAYTNNKVTKQVQEQLAQKAAYWQMANEINKASGGTYENMPSLSEYMFGKNEHKQVDDREKVKSAVKKILKDANTDQNTIDDIVNEFMDRLDDEENKAKHSDTMQFDELYHRGFTYGNNKNDPVIKAELLKAAHAIVGKYRSKDKNMAALLPSDRLRDNLNPFKGRTNQAISGLIDMLRSSAMEVLKSRTDYTGSEINEILAVAAVNTRSATNDDETNWWAIDEIYQEYPIQVYKAYLNYER